VRRAALILAACVAATLAHAAPCNGVYGCKVRAEFCTIEQPTRCHYERLLPEQGVGLCTMVMMQAAVQWITGDAAAGKPAHPGFRLVTASCVSPDDSDI
jgi:hypothetical protein